LKVEPAAAIAAKVLSKSLVERASLSSLVTIRQSAYGQGSDCLCQLLAVGLCAALLLAEHPLATNLNQSQVLSV
jgi:hypothetical protein